MRPSCYECRYSNINRVGDFAIGDFWKAKENAPDVFNPRGTFFVMVNTDKGIKYPKWYDEIVKLDYRILIIKDIDKIEEYEQEKFYELLKYKEISNFKLPKDLKIFVTYSNLDNVADSIISLCQIIK